MGGGVNGMSTDPVDGRWVMQKLRAKNEWSGMRADAKVAWQGGD